jgi:bifunctional N-acetylglucosamine-1-phosphate-uridyltransferase/glucosamine-1-phosphate-acetyltransferase GlmU-like protein
VNEHTTLLGSWLKCFGTDQRIERVLIVTSDDEDRRRLEDVASEVTVAIEVEVVVEPDPHRGTGGALHDVLIGQPWNLIVLGEVSAVPAPNISPVIDAVELGDAVMAVGISELQRPIGIYAMLKMALDQVPRVGYFDLKEQLVSSLAKTGHIVQPIELMPRHLRVAELEGWLQAIRAFEGGVHPEANVSAEARLEGTVCILKNATVKSGAAIRDSMVMEGAVIEENAIVARSVVGPGMHIAQGHRIIDGILISQLTIGSDSYGIAPSATGTGRLRRVGAAKFTYGSDSAKEMIE